MHFSVDRESYEIWDKKKKITLEMFKKAMEVATRRGLIEPDIISMPEYQRRLRILKLVKED